MSAAACAKIKLDACEPPALMASFKAAAEAILYYADRPDIEVTDQDADELRAACVPMVEQIERATDIAWIIARQIEQRARTEDDDR